MEESRLKPMDEDYDPRVFNDLYARTEGLRRSLCAGIDSKRFGVDYYEVLSWFDVKFIYVFNKYHKQFDSEILLGHIIKALQLFKYRVLRAAYNKKNAQFIMGVDDVVSLGEDIPDDTEREIQDQRLKAIMEFIKTQVSSNAYLLFEIDICPPPFILKKMAELGNNKINKIPNSVIFDYFGLEDNRTSKAFLDIWRSEIEKAIRKAKEHKANF